MLTFGKSFISMLLYKSIMKYELNVIEFILLGLSIVKIFINNKLCNKLTNYSNNR